AGAGRDQCVVSADRKRGLCRRTAAARATPGAPWPGRHGHDQGQMATRRGSTRYQRSSPIGSMIRYVKGPPPGRLTALAATPGMDWDGIGAADRADVREALIRDQSGLCTYCQQRVTIDEDPATGRPKMKIEHWTPRSEAGARQFVWSHLL